MTVCDIPAASEKFQRLRHLLRGFGRVAVAFSGGVDSTFLLHVAVQELGTERVLAILGDTMFMPRHEIADAEQLARVLGGRLLVVRCDPLADPRVSANPRERCYLCKRLLFSRFLHEAAERGYHLLLDGANADDVSDWRPGAAAARELGVRSPLQEVSLTKAEIRSLSQQLNLPTWDHPSFACLASRIPYDTPITPEALEMVEAAEAMLRARGFRQVRVRHHGDIARIEVAIDECDRLLDADLRAEIAGAMRALGFRYVTADLDGYRTGSLNA